MIWILGSRILIEFVRVKVEVVEENDALLSPRDHACPASQRSAIGYEGMVIKWQKNFIYRSDMIIWNEIQIQNTNTNQTQIKIHAWPSPQPHGAPYQSCAVRCCILCKLCHNPQLFQILCHNPQIFQILCNKPQFFQKVCCKNFFPFSAQYLHSAEVILNIHWSRLVLFVFMDFK